MNIDQAAKEVLIKGDLGIGDEYGRILTIIDFGNVDYWFDEDRQDSDNNPLAEDQKLVIDLDKLKSFCSLFSDHIRFYYGHNTSKVSFISAAKYAFGKNMVFTKPIQKVRHNITLEELPSNTREILSDKEGSYILLPKCNFDVEISVDVIKLMDEYDTLALFSSDSDFVSLNRFVRNKSNGKKVILFKAGHIIGDLRKNTDKVINAQNIKRSITIIKQQKPGV